MSVDPTTGVRTATYVETLTPTLAGTILLDGSIKPGQQITENFTTQSNEFQALPQPDGTSVDLVNGGAATVTFFAARWFTRNDLDPECFASEACAETSLSPKRIAPECIGIHLSG